ncbi:hypothetical protein HF675_09860 [Serratia sp. JUb9]|uniref:hypothetical protein n=1 Tax=Serratia sp. JUb9 TaxID=2724469 RepID=UPI00164E6D91|nr:hypothetical protein [Serratia sp. JUb9]QNK34307.1 hypothetical protein HF675_09860 [Serratia sp. JUb9]
MAFPPRQRIEPGYCVVETPGTLSSQGNILFRNPRSEAARYFMQLNADTPWVKPGHILIVADPNNARQGPALQQLRQAKNQVNQAMSQVDAEQANFLHRHYETIATVLNGSSMGLGTASDAGKRYFSRIEEILKKIESTYQNQFRTQGTLISQQFFVERNHLFNELKTMLDKPIFNRLPRKILNLHPYESMKRALNLSSRSIVHEWATVGVGAIHGYSTYLDGTSRAIRFMRNAGWVGLGVAATSTTNDIYNSCTVDRENECGRVALKGYSSFIGGAFLGAFGGTWGALAGGGVCVALGVISAPMAGGAGLACAIVGASGGSLAGGAVGSAIGEFGGDFIYKIVGG